jgi:hypothetical protein
MANTKITDILTWDEEGNVKVKAASAIPDHALQAIKQHQGRQGQGRRLYARGGALRQGGCAAALG